ncbi:hypothetical protein Ahy_A04g017624 isoform A [Arachis hypogaea]|uniref:Uncharacterized protein n=1 Tax=Arachis hypogaea TaxID=3818 RepID=A0A445DBN5_ARAHY|nr:hypothetical protein Ahy_A04g017624 isoform A [Arachis hypogaea]
MHTILTKMKISEPFENFIVKLTTPRHDGARKGLHIRNIVFVAYQSNKYSSLINNYSSSPSKPSYDRFTNFAYFLISYKFSTFLASFNPKMHKTLCNSMASMNPSLFSSNTSKACFTSSRLGSCSSNMLENSLEPNCCSSSSSSSSLSSGVEKSPSFVITILASSLLITRFFSSLLLSLISDDSAIWCVLISSGSDDEDELLN